MHFWTPNSRNNMSNALAFGLWLMLSPYDIIQCIQWPDSACFFSLSLSHHAYNSLYAPIELRSYLGSLGAATTIRKIPMCCWASQGAKASIPHRHLCSSCLNFCNKHCRYRCALKHSFSRYTSEMLCSYKN